MAKTDGTDDFSRTLELLWGDQSRSARGPKPALTVGRIVECAIEIADTEGFSALSMQRVAGELGFSTMSLYRYLPGKNELVSIMIDAALGEPPVLSDSIGDWRAKLEVWAHCYFMVLNDHPWAVLAATFGRAMGPNELGWLEAAVSALGGTALSGSEKTDAVVAVNGHVRSWVQYAANSPSGHTTDISNEHWGATVADLVRKHSDRYPALLEAMTSGAFDPSDDNGPAFGLRVVLDGIGVRIAEREAMKDRARPTSPQS
ncbi:MULTISPECIES: TetR/AcrR family transcriptional regulator C-terminal domain-containing protein [unclassified Streptomyces]|uniref:TetR/AcrR family transcriptional regulator n=1 Tax=unclassified Streptomyces TaxID=2593676 RepID=UPI002DDA1AAC|nr:TetR/AcrR family transcriptional regulator C-terminal domain-containing protein [Streptomyces sp. NBC_01750]WSA99661.1 TetR/AcrR family transcriptional regulator C-terminal domain-containing protein [Streptomyces sp. NBC_01794]WSD35890.1 TetR/AcrR family transcriptional regulator C-terminal domain-containing protein [Streptomyces sp. NBC_01750]